jgi:hypothetical protein
MNEDKLEKIRDDITEIKLSLGRIDATLDRNTSDVERHIKRSDNYEFEIQKLKQEVLPLLPEIRQMVKYWKFLSILVIIGVTGSNPNILPVLLKVLGISP